MEVRTIQQLNQHISLIEKSIKDINYAPHGDTRFGAESEFTYKSLIGGINALITDLKALTKSPEKFVKYSSHGERSAMTTTLSYMHSNINYPANLWQHVDSLKAQLKPFNIRFTKPRYVEFDKEIDDIVRRKIEISDVLSVVTDLHIQIESLTQDIKDKEQLIIDEQKKLKDIFTDLQTQNADAKQLLDEISETNLKLKDTYKVIEDKKLSIAESETSILSSEKLINSFSEKVQEREKRLNIIEAQTNEYKDSLTNYKDERDKLLLDAAMLIDNSKKALSYTTAEGLSASFNTQYDIERGSKPYHWIIAAGSCLLVALAIGIWILIDKDATLATIIGRVTMIPLPIAGAVFCANMYVKKVNIIQDYAYKMVLAKSIVGFSEQLKDGTTGPGDEYKTYMSKVLGEIHQDPLRSRSVNGKSTAEPEVDSPVIDIVQRTLSLLEKSSNGSVK